LCPGANADLVLMGLERARVLEAEELFCRHGQSLYVGRAVRTLVRGNEVFGGGKVASGPVGRLVRPAD